VDDLSDNGKLTESVLPFISPISYPHDPGQSGMRITIASRFEELEKVVDAAESFYASLLSDSDRVFVGVLLVSEAVSNAIEHGNGNDPSKRVTIEFRHDDSRTECWVEDEGDGFDRDAIADPLASENLLEDGGRGIFLIERMADEVVYENGGRRIGIVLTI
jgi:serine/threonine-protein kinase RsbW